MDKTLTIHITPMDGAWSTAKQLYKTIAADVEKNCAVDTLNIEIDDVFALRKNGRHQSPNVANFNNASNNFNIQY